MMRRLAPLLLLLLVACGQEGAGIGEAAAAALEPRVQQVRAGTTTTPTTVAATGVPSTTRGTGATTRTAREAEEEARKRAEEAAKKAEEEAKKRADEAKKRAEEGKKD